MTIKSKNSIAAIVMLSVAAFAAFIAVSAIISGSIDGPKRGTDLVLRSNNPTTYWMLVFIYWAFAAGFGFAGIKFFSSRSKD